MKKVIKSRLADMALLLVALLWGGGFISVKDSLGSLSPLYLMTFRMVIASLTFVFILPKIWGIKKEDVWRTMPAAFMLYTGFSLQTIGLQYTDVSKQGFLTATYVIFVPIILWVFYKKKPKTKVFIGCLMVLLGIGMISLAQGFSLNRGDMLTLACAVCFAFHIIFTDKAVETVDPFKFAFLQFSMAGLLFFISAFITEPVPTMPTTRGWLVLVYTGVLATFCCFLLQTIAQKYTTPSKASVFLSLESVFAAIFGVLIFHEVVTFQKLIGFVLIFAAVLLIEVDWKQAFSK